MAGFLYYLPKFQGTPSVEKMRELGLAYAFDCQSCNNRGCDTGPDNEGGKIVVHQSFPTDLMGFYREKQKWVELLSQPAWVGMYTDENSPKPKDLARAEQLSGQCLTLEDGNRWLIPIAREYQEAEDAIVYKCSLPSRFVYSKESKKWEVGSVLKRYERLWTLAEQYAASIGQADQQSQSDESLDVCSLFVESISANYRLSDEEIDMLGIFDMQAFTKTIRILLDLDRWEEIIQKKMLNLLPAGETL